MKSTKLIIEVLFLALAFTITPTIHAQNSPTSLQFSATGSWNGFLNQLNVVECSNFSSANVSLKLNVFDFRNQLLGTQTSTLTALGSLHIVLNEFSIEDSYGTYKLELLSNQHAAGAIVCQTAIYRFSSGSDKQVSYAYVLPVSNPQKGETAGLFNSFNPANENNAVLNWLSIENRSNEQTFSAEIQLYAVNGDLLENISINNLAAGGRRDLALGHNNQENNGQVLGMYRIVPSNMEDYQAYLTRFMPKGMEDFQFAFPLLAQQARCASEQIFLSTMGPANNWIEIGNSSHQTSQLRLRIFQNQGAIVHEQEMEIAPFSQFHLLANQFLGDNNLGSAEISCLDLNSKIIVNSIYYGRQNSESSAIEWAYGAQAQLLSSAAEQQLAAPLNSFLKMSNWFKTSTNREEPTPATLELLLSSGELVNSRTFTLQSPETLDVAIHTLFPADSIGGARWISSEQNSEIFGELLRVFPGSNSSIGYIMRVPAAPINNTAVQVELQQVANGLIGPTAVVSANDGSGRLFILEQPGFIRIFQNGSIQAGLFIDLEPQVSSHSEQGLLGIAFHPNYQENGRVFLNYTNTEGNSVISEFKVQESNPNRLDSSSERVLLTVEQVDENHNGGQLAFGPDGFLYISLGDGGGAGDPLGNAQNLNSFLGKILRIDVDSAQAYSIPPNNPFVGQEGARSEIWAYGLRNPWRFSFDASTGRLFSADVGQNSAEEINIIEAGGNYGWNIKEGEFCFSPPSGCNEQGLQDPIYSYSHDEGVAVIGGFVYRGENIPQLKGKYIFADYTGGKIWALTETLAGTWFREELATHNLFVSSFGEDEDGELFLTDFQGGLYRIVEDLGS